MKRVLTGDAALRREARLQQREDRLTNKSIGLAVRDAEIERLHKGLKAIYLGVANPEDYALKILTEREDLTDGRRNQYRWRG